MTEQNDFDEQKIQQQITQLEAFVRTKLTKEAYQRYSNIKVAHPELSVQVLAMLAQILQNEKIGIIDDDAFKDLLARVQPKKRDFRITRK